MSCCGQKRTEWQMRTSQVDSALPRAARSLSSGPVYQYVGPTSMPVIGRATGLRYSFMHRGARIAVDPRDTASLAAVPHLRLVS